MSTVYVVSKPCGCVLRRTLDKAEAVGHARDHGLILDAISCRTEAAERKALVGDIVLSCNCEEAEMLKVGDVVKLKAGGTAMTVVEVRDGCDGTGGDGLGLLCAWFEGGELHKAWLSESSIMLVTP